MDMQLKNQHVLITGGSRGIGLACAQAFGAEGAHITLVARNPQTLAEAVASLAAKGITARGISTDVQDPVAAQRMVDEAYAQHGPVDVLVNCAGAARRTPFEELTPQAWHDAMQAKFFAYVHVMDPVVKRMGAAGRGAIVNVVGQGGKLASPTHLAGGSANAALMLASAGLAAAYAPRNVRVNVVNPSLTQTERLEGGLQAEAKLHGKTPEDILRGHEQRIPLRRLAQPAEVADVVVFLASARASYVTGVMLAMDGAATPLVV